MADQTFDLFARRDKRVYKVHELTRELKGLLEGRFPLLQVEGEISNFRRNTTSGHCYFTLKDEGASLKCALFRNQARLLTFQPADGQHVVAKGRISVYEAGGEYNLVCDVLEPMGAGALALRFEELKKRLAAEGLFDPALKRPLPYIPRRIGVVTSPTGAAVQDFLRVLHKRWPGMPVLIAPARVQGEGAAAEIARGVQRLAGVPDIDVIVVTRGGGSLEDLWAFNEEVVARALRRSPVPVVSAVGHEVDFTIADFAADVRAPTPTGAAELIVRERADLVAQLSVTRGRLVRAMDRQLEQRKSRMAHVRKALVDPRRVIGERRLLLDRLLSRAERTLRERVRAGRQRLVQSEQTLQRQHPRVRLQRWRQELSALEQRVGRVPPGMLSRERQQLASLEQRVGRVPPALIARERRQLEGLIGRLDAMSPLKVLARGYSLAFGPRGELLHSSEGVKPGDEVRVRLSSGVLSTRVESVES